MATKARADAISCAKNLLLSTLSSILFRSLISSPVSEGKSDRDAQACWTAGYSIATDFDKKFPVTGNTVTYDLTLTNSTCNPDGNGNQPCLLINNQYPGPLIRATWGDRLVVTVHNKMQNNGTGIHWHGVRQYHSVASDGVGGITECPIAPGDSKTYDFTVTQFGTSWYHSHFTVQYGAGIVGPIIFDGPATANYDVDLGSYMINDWFYHGPFVANLLASANFQKPGPPPPGDNILINGTNKNANGGGKYGQVTITSGKKYRLRIINAAVDNYYHVSLDSHPLQIIATDFIPIKPITVETLVIAIGQRYDVVITAKQTAGNYWFRATVAQECVSHNNGVGLSIFTYDSVKPATPQSTAYTVPAACEPPDPLAPYWVQPVPNGSFTNNPLAVGATKGTQVPNGDTLVLWALSDTPLNVAWEKPTLQYVLEGNTSYPTPYHVMPTTNANGWNYWVIQQSTKAPPVPHPIHLHGHDFFVLGRANGQFSADTASLNWATPPRRDTATVPAGGWLAIAFPSNNPGVWLMHCHIAWHVSSGLGAQFVEMPDQISVPDMNAFAKTCSNWKAYKGVYGKDDSGL
ncbi:multicopper oxidase [Piedraia hortae CBS 480.64]|uniref:laccase n=1 Tax=Piedraia hortae CBS 480.64 TaxID=1314780 RepID=A0A6A7BYP0_9PEZI|nr:multicopper oxidase [Piedraia hortae CBS 480.64]